MNDETYFSRKRFLKELSICGVFSPYFFIRHFFKWQTKPRMTYHGDLYYEGKEFEIRLKEKKPGDLTDDLRTALGMPVGPNAHKVNFIIYIFDLAKNLFA